MSTVHSRHHKRVIFLLELGTQCKLAERAYERLQKCAKASIIHGEYEGEKGTPIEMLHLSHSFLTYSAVIAKIIFQKGRGGNDPILRQRCLDLQELLEVGNSPNLSNLVIRNSLEHIDKRLDEFIPEPPFTFEHYAVGGPEGREEKTVIRRFDPEKFEFWFLEDCIPLKPLFEEVIKIKAKIKPAFDKFSEPPH